MLPLLVMASATATGLLVWRLTSENQPPVLVQMPYPTTDGDASMDAGPGDPAEVGAGDVTPKRDQDIWHVVGEGETLSEIAYYYDVDFNKLAVYNKIANPNSIRPGQRILIPSLSHLAAIQVPAAPTITRPAPADDPDVALRIVEESQVLDGAVTARFSLAPGQGNLQLVNYEWTLGDGRKSFRESVSYTYSKAGTYTVALRAADAERRQYVSNKLYVNVPYPGTSPSMDQHFVTLNVGDPFRVPGEIVDVLGYSSVDKAPISVPAGLEEGIYTYAANEKGFYNLTVSSPNGELSHWFLFVSPVPSVHLDRTDQDWYRTQFNTGTQSNCGPSVISMAIGWAKGLNVPVAQIRSEIGWEGDGGIGFEQMGARLAVHGVHASIEPIQTPEQVIDLINAGNIVVLLYNTKSVKRASGDPLDNLFGSYYIDDVGHYIVVKGYSSDHKYFIVYDPIPSDWSANSVRYGDGISMIGKNRYYPASEVFATLRRPAALVVSNK